MMNVKQRLVTPEDIVKFQWPSNPTISPDAKNVVYEKTVVRTKENDYETHVHLADSSGQEKRILTTSGTSNLGPAWSPDSKAIAYLSNRENGMQAWLLSLDSGEEKRLTRFRHGISSLFWSPDGDYLYGLVPVHAEKANVEMLAHDKTQQELDELIAQENKAWAAGPKRYDQSYYKLDGVGFDKGQRRQLVAIHLATGDWKLLTNGPFDASEPVISPDGSYIAFVALRGEAPIYGGQILRVPAAGGELETLYPEADAKVPVYSPDGKWIAFLANKEHKQLYMMDATGGQARLLSGEYPFSMGDLTFTDMYFLRYPVRPQWSRDGEWIYALSTREGKNEVVRFSKEQEGASPEVVVKGNRTIFHFSFDGNDGLTIAYSSPNQPGCIAFVNSKGEEVRLDDCNEQLMRELIVAEPEEFTFSSVDDWQIQGFLLKPASFTPGEKYPILLDIHGGPHSMFCYAYFHQMQVFAAQGYAVLFINPRGSSGFGRKFSEAVHGDYGGKDHQDLLNGLTEAVRRFDFLDGSRVAINGISYGGFMVNWLLTKTDQFFAAISEGCISNWISMYGTSDISPVFIEQEFAGKTDMETLWKHSPLAYVDKVRTPLLLMHSEQDLRCPIEQAEQFYIYLKRLGREVEFLRMPDASHGLLQIGKPALRIARVQAMVDFVSVRLPQV
ncbi:S9 family peptidase [Brevibacillus choshinensis]|uniref:S9 family peptidase n=1 Tax=Brevibacillus choshinensis TaxID=54911 RepID=UPI002E1E6D6F|nr:S9 family peptidase [Brevibacillus choshinensis]